MVPCHGCKWQNQGGQKYWSNQLKQSSSFITLKFSTSWLKPICLERHYQKAAPRETHTKKCLFFLFFETEVQKTTLASQSLNKQSVHCPFWHHYKIWESAAVTNGFSWQLMMTPKLFFDLSNPLKVIELFLFDEKNWPAATKFVYHQLRP